MQPCRRSSRGHKRIQRFAGQCHFVTAPGICPYAVFSPLQRAYGPIRSQSRSCQRMAPMLPAALFLGLSLHLQAYSRDGGGLTAFNVIVNTSGHGLGLCASNSHCPSVTRPSTIMGLASLRHFVKLLYQVSPTCILLQMTRRSIILSRVAAEVPNMPS
jgi:hypothetical protein